MTYTDDIQNLPAHQQRAARSLYVRDDEHTIADAAHACVPLPVISYLAGVSVRRVREITARVDARSRCQPNAVD